MARHLATLGPRDGDCWSTVGVFGPGSPTREVLERVVHCHNCEVYAAAGRMLFEREAPADYAESWTRALRLGKEAEEAETLSLLVFRIGEEWLGLSTRVLHSIMDVKPIHSLPHRTDAVLRGLVNARGQIVLCVSLAALLAIEPSSEARPAGRTLYRRMVVIARESDERDTSDKRDARDKRDMWAFAVDEIDGIRRFRPRHLREPPITVSRHRSHFTRAIAHFGEDVLLASERGEGALPFEPKEVGCLDEARVFAALHAHVSGGARALPRPGAR